MTLTVDDLNKIEKLIDYKLADVPRRNEFNDLKRDVAQIKEYTMQMMENFNLHFPIMQKYHDIHDVMIKRHEYDIDRIKNRLNLT